MRSVVIPVLLTLLIACQADAPRQDEAGEYLKFKSYPSDHFYFQRAYPDTSFDMVAMRREFQVWQRDEVRLSARHMQGQWVSQGPANTGARVNAIAVHPEDPRVIYIGFSAGGVYKTNNFGITWMPVFDEYPFLAIGDITIDEKEPDHVWLGTGDPNISGYPFIGDGIYESFDGGENWTNIGLNEVGIVSEILVDKDDSEKLFVSSMGVPFQRDTNRGIYRTLDSGLSWGKSLFLGEGTGVIDMVMDPDNSDIIFAAGWDRIRNYDESITFGLGAKIYKTEDAGVSWALVQDVLPQDTLSRIGLAISESNPDIVCALFVNKDHDLGAIYRSMDGGLTWHELPTDSDAGLSSNPLGGFGWYFGKIRIHPTDPNRIYILGVDLWEWSESEGQWSRAAPSWWTGEVHADKHDLAFIGADTLVLATDGGLYLSTDLGASWADIENISTTQFYRVAFNPHQPERYYGGTQDNGTVHGNVQEINEWKTILGGDGFRLLFHPEDPLVFYVETQSGGFAVTTDGGGTYSSAVNGVDALDNKNWDLPILMSLHDPDILYYGTDKIYRSITGAEVEFEPISPALTDSIILLDLTSNLSALSESPLTRNILFAGTGDGNLWRSVDYGENWTNVSSELPDRYITSIHQSELDTFTVYVTHSGYKAGSNLPHVHFSSDLGDSWTDISGNLPPFAVNDLLILPNNDDQVLFAASDAGVYFTDDAGLHWERLGINMPYIPIYDLVYNPVLNQVVAGSYGKSIFSFDLQQVGLSGDPTVAVHESAVEYFRIFPNPTAGDVWITSLYQDIRPEHFVIFSLDGREMGGGPINSGERLSLESYPSGIYLLSIRDLDGNLFQASILKW